MSDYPWRGRTAKYAVSEIDEIKRLWKRAEEELTAARDEAERLRGRARARVSELESSLAEVLGNYEDSMDFPLVKRAHKALSGSAGEPEEPMDKPQ